jgi:hypothetical protein
MTAARARARSIELGSSAIGIVYDAMIRIVRVNVRSLDLPSCVDAEFD